jgi:hypothetical protein
MPRCILAQLVLLPSEIMIRSAYTHIYIYIYIRGKEKELFYKKRRLESGIKAVISKSKDGYHNFFSYAIFPGEGKFW